MGDAKDLSLDEIKKAGTPIKGDMEEEYKEFLKLLIRLLDEKEIDPLIPESFLKEKIFDALDESTQDKVSAALVNIAGQVRHIDDFYRSKETPDTSPQLQTMIMELFQMKSRLEEQHGDVLKF